MSEGASRDYPVRCWGDEIQRLGRVLLIVYFLETGLVLLVAPWSTFWERNSLVDVSPLLGGVMRLAAVRGAVSGVGIVNLCMGLWGMAAASLALSRSVSASVSRPQEPTEEEPTGSGARRAEDARPWPEGR
jgi:hypothetical protein